MRYFGRSALLDETRDALADHQLRFRYKTGIGLEEFEHSGLEIRKAHRHGFGAGGPIFLLVNQD